MLIGGAVLLVSATVALGATVVGAAPAARAVSLVSVAADVMSTPSAPAGWSVTNRPGGAGARKNPVYSSEAPQSGKGSLKLSTPGEDDQVSTYHAGSGLLSAVDEASYQWNKVKTANTVAAPAFVLWYDKDGKAATTDDVGALVYEPLYQPKSVTLGCNSGRVLLTGRWVTENVATGCVYDAAAPETYRTLGQFQADAAYAAATVLAYGLNQGSSNPGTDAYADNVSLNDESTNFEPDPVTPPPPTKTNGKPSITFSQPGCGTVDITVAVASDSNPIQIAFNYLNHTYKTVVVPSGGTTTYRFVFREDARDPNGKVQARVDVFYQSPVGSPYVLGPSRIFVTNCRK